MGIEKLIDVIIQFIDKILPFFVVDQYEQSVVLKFGRRHRVRGPGIWWKWPFAEEPHKYTIVTTTMTTPAQTIYTKDGRSVTIVAVVKYSIADVEAYMLRIVDAADAIGDITQGHLMRCVNTRTMEVVRKTSAISTAVTKSVRKDLGQFGIYVHAVTITDMVESRAFRIYHE